MSKEVALCHHYIQTDSGYPACCRISTRDFLVGGKGGYQRDKTADWWRDDVHNKS